jgi:hypothetical protein
MSIWEKIGDGVVTLSKKVTPFQAFVVLIVMIVCYTGYQVVDRVFDSHDLHATPKPVPEGVVVGDRTPVQKIVVEKKDPSEYDYTRRRTNVQPKSQ